MGNVTQTTAQIQTDLDAVEASNVGLDSVSDLSDTAATAATKSGMFGLGASSSNAPSTDRSVVITAARDVDAVGEIRRGQVVLTESNQAWWNVDDGGTLGTWKQVAARNENNSFSADQTFSNTVNLGTSELTIASGAVTVTKTLHTIDTEGDASTDDLDTINGGTAGDILIISAADDARTVVAKDGTGNLKLAGDFSMDNGADMLMLIYIGGAWQEISRSDNAS